MEPSQLQLILNVVTITGITSLAGYCYLLKKENRKLANPGKEGNTEVVLSAPSSGPRIPEQDIRSFASASRTRWVQSVSSPGSAHDCR